MMMKNDIPRPRAEAHRHPARTMSHGIYLLVALLVLVAEVLVMRLVAQGGMPPGLGLGLHGFIAIVLGLWVVLRMVQHKDLRMSSLLFICTAFLGPFGAAGVVFVLLLQLALTSMSFEEWFSSIFPRERVPEAVALEEYLRRYEAEIISDGGVVPFLDVLALGSVQQKQEMLGLIGRYFNPRFATAVKRALTDDDNAVRVQAATAIAKIENRFLEKSIALESARDVYETDADYYLALAKHYDDYAFTGIIDEDREQENRRKAMHYYKEYFALRPDDAAACYALGRMYGRAGDYPHAVEWLERCIDKPDVPPRFAIWLMEAHYALGQYATLAALAERFGKSLREEGEELPMELQDMLALWTTYNREAA